MKIIVGSRGSKLALTQTKWVLNKIKEKNPHVDFEIKVIKTKGDKILDKALDKIGDKGLFVKEIEEALLNGSVDLAVHSMKDMPSVLPEGLRFSHVTEREDHRDVIVLKEGIKSFEELPEGARIGTGSKRRKYQLLKARPDLEIVPIRGNVETRISKIESENLSGVILAAAGIKRLGIHEKMKDRIEYLSEELIVPAPAQGILALEIRDGDNELHGMIEKIRNEKTEIEAKAERAFLKGLNGSCHIPIGAYCSIRGEEIVMTGIYGDGEGQNILKAEVSGSRDDAEKIGKALADKLLEEMKRNEG